MRKLLLSLAAVSLLALTPAAFAHEPGNGGNSAAATFSGSFGDNGSTGSASGVDFTLKGSGWSGATVISDGFGTTSVNVGPFGGSSTSAHFANTNAYSTPGASYTVSGTTFGQSSGNFATTLNASASFENSFGGF